MLNLPKKSNFIAIPQFIKQFFSKFKDGKNINKLDRKSYPRIKYFSIEQIMSMKKRIDNGEQLITICHDFNISYKTLYKLMVNNFKPSELNLPTKETLIQSIVEMYKKGVPFETIVEKTGYSYIHIRKIVFDRSA